MAGDGMGGNGGGVGKRGLGEGCGGGEEWVLVVVSGGWWLVGGRQGDLGAGGCVVVWWEERGGGRWVKRGGRLVRVMVVAVGGGWLGWRDGDG